MDLLLLAVGLGVLCVCTISWLRQEVARHRSHAAAQPTPVQPPAPKLAENESPTQAAAGAADRWTPKERARPGKPSYRITYRNSRDVLHDRDVYVYKKGANQYLFEAWCSMEKCRRSFWFARVLAAIDLETGEILNPSELYERIHVGRNAPAWLAEPEGMNTGTVD